MNKLSDQFPGETWVQSLSVPCSKYHSFDSTTIISFPRIQANPPRPLTRCSDQTLIMSIYLSRYLPWSLTDCFQGNMRGGALRRINSTRRLQVGQHIPQTKSLWLALPHMPFDSTDHAELFTRIMMGYDLFLTGGLEYCAWLQSENHGNPTYVPGNILRSFLLSTIETCLHSPYIYIYIILIRTFANRVGTNTRMK